MPSQSHGRMGSHSQIPGWKDNVSGGFVFCFFFPVSSGPENATLQKDNPLECLIKTFLIDMNLTLGNIRECARLA